MSDRFAGEVNLVSGDDFLDEFFAPSSTDMVDGLVGQYRQARERIAAVAQFAEGDTCKAVIDYFLSGNANEFAGASVSVVILTATTKNTFSEPAA